jgi:hypothetical protein
MADDIWKGINIDYTGGNDFIPTSSTDWLKNFVWNPVASGAELFGISPDAAMDRWRMENPGWAMAGELLGAAVPYAGWTKAAGSIPKLAKAIEWAGGLSENAFISGALKEGVRQAPFELGRVLASQVVGDQDLGTMAGNAGVNLALGAGLGGVVEGVMSAGTRNLPIARMIPGLDVSSPRQLQIRHLKNAINEAGAIHPDNVGPVNKYLTDLELQSRLEYLTDGKEKYVTRLEGMESDVQAELLNRMFKPSFGKGGLSRKRFNSGKTDFGTEEAWQAAAKDAGLPDNFSELGQYFREVSFTGARAQHDASLYGNTIQRNMDAIGDNWFLKREGDDGLWVMAKKAKGKQGTAAPDDKWVIFKTDQPGKFSPSNQKWERGMINHQAWNPIADMSRDGGRIYNSVKGFKEKFPFFNYAKDSGGDPRSIGKALEKIMPKNLKGGNALAAGFRDAATEYLTPARLQFVKNARANHIMTAVKEAYDAAEAEGTRMVNGTLSVDQGKSLWHAVMGGYETVTDASKKSLRQVIEGLKAPELADLNKIIRSEAHSAKLQSMLDEGKISRASFDAAKRLEEIDSEIFADMNKAQKAAGQPITKARAGHYGAGREWKGDSRIVLRGEDGEVKAIASADSRRGAQARAKFIQEKMAAEGKAVKIAEEFRRSELERIPKDVKPILNTPQFTMERGDIRGWHGDFEDLSAKELMETLENNVRGRMRYQANLSVTDLLARDVNKLAIEDPLAHRLVTARMNDRAGVQSPFAQLQNNITDKVLAPIMGKNSASKIVRTTNSVMWNIQLGAGNIIHPITDAMSFIQVVAPEVAFVTTASPDRLGKYTWLASGNGQGVRGSLGVLNPLVLMKDAFSSMRKPTKELSSMFARAANDGVIDPRIVEDYVGESAGKLTDMRRAIASPGGFADWVKAASEFMPAMVEKGSRAYAFTVGTTIAKDHFGITDPDQIYLMAKQFTEHTMYSYGASDRPRIMTTPLGGAFGLFKNWMANYTGSMLEYMGEGVMHNNWSPLIWQTAGTFALGGVAATPLGMVADGFSEMFTGKDMLENTYSAFNGENEWAANGLMFGLPAMLTGLSVSGRVSSPLSDPIHNSNILFSIAHMDRAQYLGKTFGEAMDHWYATGQAPAGDPRFWQLLARATAPGMLYRTMSTAQEGTITSLASGYPEMKNLSGMDQLLYTIGFSPVELERGRAIANRLYDKQAERQAHTTALGEAFAQAQLSGDVETMTRILRQAYASGLDPSAINRSAAARISKMQTPLLERNFKPEDILRYKLGGQ